LSQDWGGDDDFGGQDEAVVKPAAPVHKDQETRWRESRDRRRGRRGARDSNPPDARGDREAGSGNGDSRDGGEGDAWGRDNDFDQPVADFDTSADSKSAQEDRYS
jgi:hypothetical protein